MLAEDYKFKIEQFFSTNVENDPFKSIDFTKDVSEWHNEPILTNFVPSRKGAIFDVLALKMGKIGASTATLTPGFTKKLDELIAALRNSSG